MVNKPEYYFRMISQISRATHHEEKIAACLEQFAIERHLHCYRDQANNIVITKAAAPNYADHEPIILQGHMDMVAAKEKSGQHDFSNDPLQLEIKDGYLSAYQTTLGADDGVALAYMLAILDDDTIKHPFLTCIFTTGEEIDFSGALALDLSDIKGHRFISLDECDFGVCCVSSLGSQSIDITRKTVLQKTNAQGYRLSVSGLLGGHSGADIVKERANSIILLVRALDTLNHVQLAAFTADHPINVIPADGEVIFYTTDDINRLILFFDDVKNEYQSSDPDITFTLEETAISTLLSEEDSKDLIAFLTLIPNGTMTYSALIPDYPVLSSNVAAIAIHQDQIICTIFYRSSFKSMRKRLLRQFEKLAALTHFSIHPSNDEDGWEYEENNPLRSLLQIEFKNYFHQDLKLQAAAGGLETAVFKAKRPDFQIVTLGPNIIDYHTPNERLDLHSFNQIYDFLIYFLEKV